MINHGLPSSFQSTRELRGTEKPKHSNFCMYFGKKKTKAGTGRITQFILCSIFYLKNNFLTFTLSLKRSLKRKKKFTRVNRRRAISVFDESCLRAKIFLSLILTPFYSFGLAEVVNGLIFFFYSLGFLQTSTIL